MCDPSTERVTFPNERFDLQKQLIESLISDEALQALENRSGVKHPIKDYIKICELMINQKGLIDLEKNLEQIPMILTVTLDSYVVSKCSSRIGQSLSLGGFENYGEGKIVERIKSRILDPNDFLSLMTEFFCAARFSGYSGRSIIALPESENPGEKTPDFLLMMEELDKDIAFDCKRIRSESRDRAIGDRISDANRQIRSYSERNGEIYGVAVVDVSEKLRQHIDDYDAFYENLRRFKDIASNKIKDQNTSLSGVLIVWDHFHYAGSLDQVRSLYDGLKIPTDNLLPEKLLLFIRSGEFLPHANPKHQISQDFIHRLFDGWGISTGVDIYNYHSD
jgi:hypothetical protein